MSTGPKTALVGSRYDIVGHPVQMIKTNIQHILIVVSLERTGRCPFWELLSLIARPEYNQKSIIDGCETEVRTVAEEYGEEEPPADGVQCEGEAADQDAPLTVVDIVVPTDSQVVS